MVLLAWMSEYETGHTMIDDDHRHLVEVLNQLYELRQRPRDEIAVVLSELVSHTRDHFAREEELMAYSAYPRADIHWRDHDSLLHDLFHIKEEYDHGGFLNMEEALSTYLKFWLLSHIMNEDIKLADFLLQHPDDQHRV